MSRISYVKHTPKHRADDYNARLCAWIDAGRVSLRKPTHRAPAARPADVLVGA